MFEKINQPYDSCTFNEFAEFALCKFSGDQYMWIILHSIVLFLTPPTTDTTQSWPLKSRYM